MDRKPPAKDLEPLLELVEPGRCFYCGAEIREQWEVERDHFPIADRHGGTTVVPSCRKCHFLKDRAPKLPGEVWDRYLEGCSKRLGLAALVCVERPSVRIRRALIRYALREWKSLNWETRLVVAKILCGRDAPALAHS